MKARDFRKLARDNLKGKWGHGALITLAFMLIIYILLTGVAVFELTPLSILFFILYFILIIPLGFSLPVQFLKLQNNDKKDVKIFDFINWSNTNFTKSWKVLFSICKKIIVPLILLIISIIVLAISMVLGLFTIVSNENSVLLFELAIIGAFFISLITYIISLIFIITKGFYYSLCPLILADNPDLSAKEIVNKSKDLMTNNRWKLFCLYLSFIGWAILCIFTLGIGYFFLVPYIQMSLVSFYKDKLENSNVKKEEEK